MRSGRMILIFLSIRVEYDPPEVILDRIDELEKEIQDNMAELRKLLNSNLWRKNVL